MPELIHNYGLELHVYPPETEVVSKFRLKPYTVEDLPGEYFIREVLLHTIGATSLKQALHIADQELDVVAEALRCRSY